jgi:hypothetical protein
VVAVGETLCESLVAPPVSTPWSIVQVSALVADQLKVDDSPCVMAAGVAENVSIVGRLPTVTVTLSVTEPFVLVAVIV